MNGLFYIRVVLPHNMPPDSAQLFVCPECEESIEVNEEMKATLLETGCVLCRAPIDESDIQPI